MRKSASLAAEYNTSLTALPLIGSIRWLASIGLEWEPAVEAFAREYIVIPVGSEVKEAATCWTAGKAMREGESSKRDEPEHANRRQQPAWRLQRKGEERQRKKGQQHSPHAYAQAANPPQSRLNTHVSLTESHMYGVSCQQLLSSPVDS
jgi:hypothetical protein